MFVTDVELTRPRYLRQLPDVTEPSATAERVLVVDDEPDIVALVAYHLAKSGFSVSTATSGTEGLAVARRDKPSIIVLDLMLPGLSGLEVMEELRGDPATSRIAVLLLLLAERKGRVQPRNLLLEIVWEAAPDIQTRTVDMHVQRLRAKLGPAGDLIETVRGFGYRIKNVSERS